MKLFANFLASSSSLKLSKMYSTSGLNVSGFSTFFSYYLVFN